MGTVYNKDSIVMVGERGPELVVLAKHEKVLTAKETKELLMIDYFPIGGEKVDTSSTNRSS